MARGLGTQDLSSSLRALCTEGDGPLLALGERDTIETWTEGELCTLHAATRLLPIDAWWLARATAAVQWHLEWTQPDNATNRPWAIHAFLALGGIEGRLYAETMLHNAQAGGAQGDPLVRWALADAARWLGRGIPLRP